MTTDRDDGTVMDLVMVDLMTEARINYIDTHSVIFKSTGSHVAQSLKQPVV